MKVTNEGSYLYLLYYFTSWNEVLKVHRPSSQVFNASEEIAKAAAFTQVRLFTAALKSSDTPEEELLSVEQQWAVAGPGKIILFNHSSE